MNLSMVRSLLTYDNPFNSTDEILLWIAQRNREVEVRVEPTPFAALKGWGFDPETGNLVHQSGKFFSIVGLDVITNVGTVSRWTQPVISQPEVGYLGIISSDYSYGTLGFFLKQAAEGKITLFGDGSQRRTFTHVGDICEIVNRLATTPIEGVFNIGGTDLTLFEAATAVAARKGASVVSVPWPDIAQKLESGSTFFDSSRLASFIHFDTYRVFSL